MSLRFPSFNYRRGGEPAFVGVRQPQPRIAARTETLEYDNLNYDFSFDIFLPGDSESTRLVTENLSVDSETEYTFVLAGTFADPEIILWRQFGRNWQQELEDADDASTTVTVLETSFGSGA